MTDQILGRILVADDEDELRNILVATLNRQGYQAVGVASGQDALTLLKTETFDILLSDLMMPGMDGLTLLQTSLEIDPDLIVVMMTGQGSVPTAIKAMKTGAFDYLLKPFKAQSLLPSLTRALEVRRLRLDNVQLRQSVAIYKLSQIFASTPDLATIIEQTAEASLQQWETGEVSVLLLLVRPEADELQIAAVRGENRLELIGQRLSLDQGIAGWVAHHHEPVILSGLTQDPRSEFLPPDLPASISMPMLANNKLIGLLHVNALRHPRPFTPGQVKALSLLANIAASAIENAQLDIRLHEDEVRFRQVWETTSDAMALSDSQGIVLAANPAYFSLYGYTPEQVIGHSFAIIFSEEFRPQALERYKNVFASDMMSQTFEGTVTRRADDSERVVETRVTFLTAAGKRTAMLSTIRDITERMRSEAKIKRQLEHLTALSAIDQIIAAYFDLKLSLAQILNHVLLELGVDGADILILNQHTKLLEYGAERGFRSMAVKTAAIRVGESYAGRAALERRVINIPYLSGEAEDMLPAHLRGEAFIAYYAVPLIAKGQVNGVLEVAHRTALKPDAEWINFLNTLGGQIALAIDNGVLFESLQRSNLDLSLAYDATIEGWSRALDMRDKETEGHSLRVTDMTVKLARTFGLSEAELVQIRWGALLHDIGKMGIPDGILLKPGPLTDEEWVAMKKHPAFAYEMLSPIRYLQLALDIPYCHHEKWDGTGYPRGLKGSQIPLSARIFAVVDVVDALSSDRPYRPAWAEDKVREHIQASSGTHFDPQVVSIFMQNPQRNTRPRLPA